MGNSALRKNDIITVVGASGNVGRLVAGRLASLGKYKVQGICRNINKTAPYFADNNVKLFEGNTRDGNSLKEALRGAAAVVVCTGTTAFPTKAWDGGNTPSAVDNIGVKNVLDAWKEVSKSRKRLILMSSILVTRRDQFPGLVLNGMKFFGNEGVLDAKAAGETAVIDAAREGKFDYSIIRPGQLFGGPYTNNFYLGTLFELDKGVGDRGLLVSRGDTIAGDTLRSTLAEVIAQTIELSAWTAGTNDFAVVNVKGTPPDTAQLQMMLSKV
eukprot:gene9942-20674_t